MKVRTHMPVLMHAPTWLPHHHPPQAYALCRCTCMSTGSLPLYAPGCSSAALLVPPCSVSPSSVPPACGGLDPGLQPPHARPILLSIYLPAACSCARPKRSSAPLCMSPGVRPQVDDQLPASPYPVVLMPADEARQQGDKTGAHVYVCVCAQQGNRGGAHACTCASVRMCVAGQNMGCAGM